MREIKFRAWDIERKKFNFLDLRDAVGGDDAYSLCGNQGTKWEEDRKNSCTMSCKCEIQQFTGLKDKNGKEIYEGDVVNFYNAIKGYVKGKIVFEHGVFIVACNKLNDSYSALYEEADSESDCVTVEVIGNICENPELLNANQVKEGEGQ